MTPLRVCPQQSVLPSLADIVREATSRAFAEPAEPTPQEQFDRLCRIAGLPTFTEDLAGWQESLVRESLARLAGDPVIATFVVS